MEKKAEENKHNVKSETTLSSSEEGKYLVKQYKFHNFQQAYILTFIELDTPPPLVCSSFVTEPRDSVFSSSEEDVPDLIRRSNSYSSESGDEICRESIAIEVSRELS